MGHQRERPTAADMLRDPKTQTPSAASFKAIEGAETFPWVPAGIYPDPHRATAWKLPEIVVGTPAWWTSKKESTFLRRAP